MERPERSTADLARIQERFPTPPPVVVDGETLFLLFDGRRNFLEAVRTPEAAQRWILDHCVEGFDTELEDLEHMGCVETASRLRAVGLEDYVAELLRDRDGYAGCFLVRVVVPPGPFPFTLAGWRAP